jgi:predicted TIM-barrel fold metal-dependent hydrolase
MAFSLGVIHKEAMKPFNVCLASQTKTWDLACPPANQYRVPVLLLLSLAWGSLTWGASPEQLLLKDFKPRSIYRVPASKVERARFPVIDMHTHDNAKTDEQVAAWVLAMDELGIQKSTILCQAHGQAFDAVIARYKKYPGRFSVWCGFDFTGYDQPGFGPAAVAELERCFKAGAEGVGEMGDKGKGLFYTTPAAWGVHMDDLRMDPLLEKCGELGMPVSIHVADPMWMYEPMDQFNDGLMNAYQWRLDNQTNILSHAELLGTLERAAKKHPRTFFVACHFANCCYDLARLGAMFDGCPNLYADISARFAETATIPRAAAKFYQKYQDRLVYGTDMGRGKEMYQTTFRILETEDEHFYDWDQFTYHWPLYGLGLSDDVLKKVYQENAQAVLRKARANAQAGR